MNRYGGMLETVINFSGEPSISNLNKCEIFSVHRKVGI
jgi:hypothetical protein